MGIGMLIFAGISAAASIGGMIFSSISSSAALKQQQEMIKSQQLNNKYKTLVRKNNTLDEMQITLQKNEAHQAVSGAKSNSPSVFAMQSSVIQDGDRALKNADAASSFNNYALSMQSRIASTQNTGRQISVISGGISSAASAAAAGASGYQKYESKAS